MLIWSAALVTAMRNPQFSSRPGDEGLMDGWLAALSPDPGEHGVFSLLVTAAGDVSEVIPSFSSWGSNRNFINNTTKANKHIYRQPIRSLLIHMHRKQNFETPVFSFSFRYLSSFLLPLFLPRFFATHLADFISVGIVYGKVFLKDLKVGWWTKILIRTLHVFCLFSDLAWFERSLHPAQIRWKTSVYLGR